MAGVSSEDKNIPSKIFSIDGEPIMECVINKISGAGARIVVAYLPELVPDAFRLEIDNVRPKCHSGNDFVVKFFR
jgi:hypothetical protein